MSEPSPSGAGEAVTCFNIGIVYRSFGALDKAIEYVTQCVALDEQIEHPDLESDRHMLEQLKHGQAVITKPLTLSSSN